MRRRRFIRLAVGSAALGALGCAARVEEPGEGGAADASAPPIDASPGAADAARARADAGGPGCDAQTVMVYDTYAQALYLDGSYGPLTGVIRAAYVRDGVAVELDFWHGHNGQQHRFVLEPVHFEGLLAGEKVFVETTEVDSHRHMLFIDPTDLDYRVPDGEALAVPVGC